MQQNRLMKRTAVYCIAFTFAAMSAMLYYSANKIIVVADIAQDEVVQSAEHEGAAGEKVTDKTRINIDRDSQDSDYFCIPLPDNVKPEEVTLENHYMDQEVWVSIDLKNPEDQRGFYESKSVYGDCENVLDGHFDVEKKRICLRFALTGVFEYQSVFENNTLYVKFVPPKEVYDKIVVIDPAYGADENGGESDGVKGKNITLDIAKALKTKMDETDIKVYYTRMDDSNPDDRTRVRLAVATDADMLIRIEVGSAENSRIYGTEAICNSRFFIPDFGSVELADLLEREVVTAISGKANGLVEVTEADVVIREVTVPAAAIKAGYLTNSQEFVLLQRDDYIEKIADGICRTIQKVYDKYGAMQTEECERIRDAVKPKIIFATGNEGKMREIRAILGDMDAEICSMKEAGIQTDIIEDGRTFEENAIIKAKTIAVQTDAVVLADDSGLEIDYLNKEPGIYSARYMGEDTPYSVKNKNLIDRLAGVPDEKRTARFVCAIAAAFPDGQVITTQGVIEGRIGYEEKGSNGFGYDPIFYVPEYGCSTAQLTEEQKNRISHRGKALEAMKLELKKRMS